MPISQANRLRAESWAANMMEVAENVCRPYPMEDPFGPAQLAVSKEVDNTTQQVIAYHTKGARNYSSTGTLA